MNTYTGPDYDYPPEGMDPPHGWVGHQGRGCQKCRCGETAELEAGPVACQRPAGHAGPHSDDSPGDGSWHYWGPAPILTCPEGSPDYVECSCGNDPISSRGFYICEADGSMYDGNEYRPLIRCEDCGAIYDGAEIDAAEGIAGATFAPVGVVQIHVTETEGHGNSWRATCRCGWRSVEGISRGAARAVGDKHLESTNGQEVN
jgi:hypothetical protein